MILQKFCVQNTQNSFRLYDNGIELPTLIGNLQSLGVSMFSPISPYVNWKNTSNWIRTKNIFQPYFKHTHLSATSSDIGLDKLYFNKQLIGGSAILTFGLWSSKVSHSSYDDSGMGTFCTTTIKEREAATYLLSPHT
jgi:hypothetical protein